jgi:hypothetical protein
LRERRASQDSNETALSEFSVRDAIRRDILTHGALSDTGQTAILGDSHGKPGGWVNRDGLGRIRIGHDQSVPKGIADV